MVKSYKYRILQEPIFDLKVPTILFKRPVFGDKALWLPFNLPVVLRLLLSNVWVGDPKLYIVNIDELWVPDKR